MTSSLIGRWDDSLYTGITHHRTRRQDALFRCLSLLGDQSRVWVASAGTAAALGGAKGRTVARQTVIALGAASILANVALKLLVRRPRPSPPHPVLVRRPRSRSFPSGHAATSFAAATVLASRFRWTSPVLLPLAAGIALSRVYNGVHYPLDVVGGAVVGALVGAAVVASGSPVDSQGWTSVSRR